MTKNFRDSSLRSLIALIVFPFIIPVSIFAADEGHVFRNHDLKKYNYSSSEPDQPEENGPDNKEDVSENEEPELDQFAIPYIAYAGTTRRIIIPVTFNDLITAPMLLDTGAPGMHISERLAEKLNIFNNDEGNLLVNIGGLGGTVPAVFTIIDSIRVGKAEDNFIPTTISPSISDHFEGLIGMDFMANYTIQIDTRQHLLIFNELPDREDMPAGHDESWWKITFHRFRSMRYSWGEYRDYLEKQKDGTDRIKRLIKFADRQYGEAEYLYNRLSVYASEHSVPLEWR